jgi:hypothetical protein
MPSFRARARVFFAVALVLLAACAARAATTQTPDPKRKAHAAAHPSQSTVEVMNGGSHTTQSFDGRQPVVLQSASTAKRQFRPEYRAGQVARPDARGTSAPGSAPSNGVVIFNGNQKETRVFNPSSNNGPVKNLPPVVVGIATAGSKNRSAKPVVVGISSSASAAKPVVVNVASAESNAHPVVVGIASSGFQSAGPVAPVAVGMSPRPAKRPPYRPAALDAQ